MLTIQRIYQSDCTLGILNLGDEFRCHTVELPWLDNQRDISCIPQGTYECQKHHSPTHGLCISVKNVIDRSDILIHVANSVTELLGCVAVGEYVKDINSDGIPDVANSAKTLDRLLSLLPDKFQLVIS